MNSIQKGSGNLKITEPIRKRPSRLKLKRQVVHDQKTHHLQSYIPNSEAVAVGFQSEIEDFFVKEMSKRHSVSYSVAFAVTFLFCFVVCFVVLHVKIELHFYRQMLHELMHQRQKSLVKRNAARDEEADYVLTILQRDSDKGKDTAFDSSDL